MKLIPVSTAVNGGTLDLYDRLHQRVVDWKVPGDASHLQQVVRGSTETDCVRSVEISKVQERRQK